jgi:hypothetical protein
MSDEYPHEIIIRHRGGRERVVRWCDWAAGNTEACRAQARFHLGGEAGIGTFSLAHGWGAKPLDDWRIEPGCQDRLIAWAKAEQGRDVRPMPRSTGRKVQPKRGAKVRKEQLGFGWEKDQDQQGSGTSAKR